ncbi:hypothetical protein BC628DRAFT_851119 [Trametes gibbosa]|nr:hypothetical protein BC628DRAFT_851119 [Trametes gibbosa]
MRTPWRTGTRTRRTSKPPGTVLGPATAGRTPTSIREPCYICLAPSSAHDVTGIDWAALSLSPSLLRNPALRAIHRICFLAQPTPRDFRDRHRRTQGENPAIRCQPLEMVQPLLQVPSSWHAGHRRPRRSPCACVRWPPDPSRASPAVSTPTLLYLP